MEFMKECDNAVETALKLFKAEFGKLPQEGDTFVTVLENATLIIRIEDGTLKEEFIGGKPYKANITLSMYEGG